jgi:hypothetical protein
MHVSKWQSVHLQNGDCLWMFGKPVVELDGKYVELPIERCKRHEPFAFCVCVIAASGYWTFFIIFFTRCYWTVSAWLVMSHWSCIPNLVPTSGYRISGWAVGLTFPDPAVPVARRFRNWNFRLDGLFSSSSLYCRPRTLCWACRHASAWPIRRAHV